jgi:hypothetical protein
VAPGRERDQRPRERHGTHRPTGDAVRQHLDEQVHLAQRRGGPEAARDRPVQHGEELEHQVVPGPKVRAFVGHHRGQLLGRERREGALGEHHPSPQAGQAVCRRRGVREHAHVVAGVGPQRVDEGAVPPALGAQPGADGVT